MIWDDTREDWDARPPTSPLTFVSPHLRVGRTWHWAGPATHLAGKPHTACLAMVRAWQLFHQADRGWKDLGYNGLVCPHARAIEGRGADYSASHSPSWNSTRWGIQYMIGTGESATPEMLARGARLAGDLEQLAGHPLDDTCHKDDPKVATECPGDQLTAWVRAGGPTTREDDDMSQADVDQIKAYLAKVLVTGYTVDGQPRESIAAVDAETRRRVTALGVQLEGLTAAVEALAASQGADSAAIVAEVGAAVRERLAQVAIVDSGAP